MSSLSSTLTLSCSVTPWPTRPQRTTRKPHSASGTYSYLIHFVTYSQAMLGDRHASAAARLELSTVI
ncbi:hypothetical protein E2C01_087095 [Portunus trituberculatus]|uniref:Uncharacterized protein n=1 Tax=Portunus trituberculatus TaxID=210409 RepID=A0A5B7JBG9_PORTR|nr:hypothetical protein [Portunus trituberculatus]